MSLTTFTIRILFCFILSILVGLERQYRHRMVGLRTNVLVSLGAFLFVSMSFNGNDDSTRIAAQVVSGIGFLGAGVILRDGNKIKGLNTAATLWCVSAIGVLCAAGMIAEACIGTLLVLASNIILRFISIGIMENIAKNSKLEYTINIACDKKSEVKVRNLLATAIELNHLTLESLEKSEITEHEVKFNCIIITSRKEVIEDLLKNISKTTGINNIKLSHEPYLNSDNEDSDYEKK